MAIVIPYVKQTWTDGSGGGTPVSAARLGVVEEGILDVSQAPAVRVFHNAAQATLSNTPLTLAFNSERYDQAGGVASTQHDTVTNNSRLTALYAGIYSIVAMAEWAGSPVNAEMRILLNATTIIARTSVVADYRYMNLSTQYQLAVNDFVQVVVLQISGAGLNVNSTANSSPEFAMTRVA